MPWRGLSVMDQREEFVKLALMPGANRKELCRRFGISRKTGYKLLRRHAAEGRAGLADRSRRPRRSPARTPDAIEQEVLRLRQVSNDAWGGRKIGAVMRRAGRQDVPSASTITAILRRYDKLGARAGEHPGPYQRFERAAPNELWQMDFKGHFATIAGRCHPLSVLDDHSRYAVGLTACGNEQEATVRDRLVAVFRRYGLPWAMIMDNGAPWGNAGDQPYTIFTVWLLRLGVRVIHGRPSHPQTQGKDERFHRTLKAEVLHGRSFRDLPECQQAFDTWRQVYNHERPHEALGLAVPADRYRPSPRAFPKRCRRSNTGPATSSARSTRAPTSTSTTGNGASAEPSAASRSPCARRPKTVCSTCITAPTASPLSICAARNRGRPVGLWITHARYPQPHRPHHSHRLKNAIEERLASVTHVPEHLSPMSPVHTEGEG
jgi:transposase InsO family protein